MRNKGKLCMVLQKWKLSPPKKVSGLFVSLLAGMMVVAFMAVNHSDAEELASAAAPDGKGYFEDIKNSDGAVTGTAYQNADEEIAVNIKASSSDIVIDVAFRYPNEFPYREIEELALKEYQLIGPDGTVVCSETENAQYSNVSDGKTSFQMELGDVPDGEYTLQILSFEGLNTPEQPLVISGTWETKYVNY